jgi:hypothetical protein
MPRIRWRDFSAGLFVAPPRDSVPAGTLARATGIRNPALGRALRTRWGSRLVASESGPVHSIVSWHRRRYFGVGTTFGLSGLVLTTLANAKRLTFASGIPTTGAGTLAEQGGSPEHLFVAGGGRPIKVRDGNVVENWGIDHPGTGSTAFTPFAAAPVDFAQGENFMFWEPFNTGAGAVVGANPIQATSDVSGMQIVTDLLPPDGLSQAALTFSVRKGRSGIVQRPLPDFTNNGTIYRDFRVFGTPVGGAPSALQDWIVLDVMVDKPQFLESFQLNFGTLDFTTGMTHFREIIVDDAIVRTVPDQPAGVGDIASVRSDQPGLVDSAPGAGPSSQFVRQAATALAVDRLSPQEYAWTRLKIPKSSFTVTNLPDGREPWEAITIWQLVVRANAGGDVNVWVDNGSMFGGTGMQGKYQYLQTFRNSRTGTRSNPNATPVVVEAPYRTGVWLSGLAQPSDLQVDRNELWRTVGNGSLFFYLAEIQAGLLAYLDQHPDYPGMAEYSAATGIVRPDDHNKLVALDDVQLQFDNIPPPATMRDVCGPHLGRLFGTRDTAPGHGGRVYFTPEGRLESFPDFLTVAGDDDPMQRCVIYAGTLFAFSTTKVWEIAGAGPFEARELFGVHGSRYPFTVLATPYGVAYLARDGVRLFNGASSDLVAPAGILVLFRGEPGDGLAPFPTTNDPERVMAAFLNDEYVLTDGIQTLAVNLLTGAWRDLGTGFLTLATEHDTNKLLVALGTEVLDWEVPGLTTDGANPDLAIAGTAIPLHVVLPAVLPDAGLDEFIAQRLYLDVDTSGQPLLVTLFRHDHRIADGGGPFTVATTERQTVEVPVCTPIGVGYVALDALATQPIEVVGVELDVHVPVTPDAT